MRAFLLTAAGLTTAALLLTGPVALAQLAPVASAQTTGAALATTDASARPRPLFKLGTGLTDDSGIGGFRGLTLPLVLGAEQQLAPGWSVTLNAASLWNVGQRRNFGSFDREGLKLRQVSLDASIRHYYHQEKRRAAGRRTGPYEGPYVALQLNNNFERRLLYTSSSNYGRHDLAYDYSSLTAVWGVQRRLGGHGLLDAYIGGGVANPRFYRQYLNAPPEYRRELGIGLELGVKISLVK